MTLALVATGPTDADPDVERDAISIESQVFLEEFGNTRSELDALYEPYRDQTVFMVAYDSKPIGMMRLFLPGPRLQLSLKDAAAAPFHAPVWEEMSNIGVSPTSILDLAATAVTADHRGKGVFQEMAAKLANIAGAHSLLYCCAIFEQHVLAYLEREGLSCQRLAEPGHYLGSHSVPVLFESVSMAKLRR